MHALVAGASGSGKTNTVFHQRKAKSQATHSGLAVVNPNAAAIDIGATIHVAAVGADRASDPVRSFGSQGTARHRNAEQDRGARSTTRSTPAMSMLRRPHDHHRDHPWRRPAARPTGLARGFRNVTVMTRPNETQLRAEALLLRPSGSCAPAPAPAMPMTIASDCFSPGHCPMPVLKTDLSCSASPESCRSLSSFCLRRRRRTLKSP
jgi:hypothetical protein